MSRVYNFSAGPAALPTEVLEQAQAEMLEWNGSGMSVMEMSHRSKEYDAVHQEAMQLCMDVYQVPDDFGVMFVQGGASLQFAMVPMNLPGIERQKIDKLGMNSSDTAQLTDVPIRFRLFHMLR